MKKLLFAAILLSLFFSPSVFSQFYTQSGCEKFNSNLKEQVKSGVIKGLFYDDYAPSWAYEAWTSSMLKPSGKPPKKPVGIDDDPEIEQEYRVTHNKWSCRYSAFSARDKNPKTAWSEGVKGYGKGEMIIVPIELSKPVKIWNGLGNPKYYKANNRVKEARVYVLQVVGNIFAGESFMEYRDIAVLNSHVVTLKDINGYQNLPLPSYVLQSTKIAKQHGDQIFVAVEIISVYKGSRWNDTCISEIIN